MPEHASQPKLPTSESPLVELRHVNKSFGSLEALSDLSVQFPAGQVTVVLGPSGSGKSVMLKHIIGLLKPTSGEVWFDGRRIDQLKETTLSDLRARFGYLFQRDALFDSMTVRENIEFPLREHGAGNRVEQFERVSEVLRLVGLAEKLDAMPQDLSGGQRKRIALARAIVLYPEVILYDEPTTGLDPINSDVINELILKLQRDLSVTSIVVTHDLALTFKVADCIVVLRNGHLVASGTPDEIRRSGDAYVQQFLEGRASDEDLAALNLSGRASATAEEHPPMREAI